jgi:hypothetical protein
MAVTRPWDQTRRPTRAVSGAEKQAIIAACERLIADYLKPRFQRKITPTQFNYPIDIGGAWSGGRYRFFQRYRSGFEENRGQEFNAPFARLDCIGPDSFDIYWMQGTGRWWRVHSGVTLAEAMRLLEMDELLHPD